MKHDVEHITSDLSDPSQFTVMTDSMDEGEVERAVRGIQPDVADVSTETQVSPSSPKSYRNKVIYRCNNSHAYNISFFNITTTCNFFGLLGSVERVN